MDGDGDLDVLVAIEFEGQLTWWENTDGSGTAWTDHLIDATGNWEVALAADLDGDGDADAVSVRTFARDLFWWENLNGSGTAWNRSAIALDPSIDALTAADLDKDGDVDLVDGASWWENVAGDGNEWARRTIATGFSPTQVVVSDVDSDDDPDVLAIEDAPGSEHALLWFENLSGDAMNWARRDIDPQIGLSTTGTIADFDGDGDPDAAAEAELEGFPQAIVVWKNTLLSELGCDGDYNAGDRVELTASPDPGAGVGGWTGTDDDDSTSRVNRVTMPAAPHAASADYLAGCFLLTLGHTGEGSDPVASPPSSPGCAAGRYVVGEAVDLTAEVAGLPGWHVGGWSGTDDDGSQAGTNRVTMPATDHAVAVHYAFDDTCYALTLDHTGSGADPVASPTASDGCATGSYLRVEPIDLLAAPDPGWAVAGWIGTDDDGSQAVQNTLTMPATDHIAGVEYGVDQIVVGGGCSLADAIQAANTDSAVGGCEPGAGADTLVLTDDVSLTSALPLLTTEIAIEANGHSIARTGIDGFRILEVGVTAELELHDAEIRNGLGPDGAGIMNHGRLTVTNSTISGNVASGERRRRRSLQRG